MTDLRARLAEVLALLDAADSNETIAVAEASAWDLLASPALARALEDAERYAWLREHPEGEIYTLSSIPGAILQLAQREQLDTAIDAARKP